MTGPDKEACKMTDGVKCPMCGKRAVVPVEIDTAEPSAGILDHAGRGEFVLGAPVAPKEEARWVCDACGARFQGALEEE